MGQDTIQDCAALRRKVRELRRAQKVTQAQLTGLANTGTRFVKWYGSLRFFGTHPSFEAELSQHPVA